MSKYRILEKKGIYKTRIEAYGKLEGTQDCSHLLNEQCQKCSIDKEVYIPRYIVQIEKCIINEVADTRPPRWVWKDLKEFTSLEEARKYKRNLELDDGIVIE